MDIAQRQDLYRQAPEDDGRLPGMFTLRSGRLRVVEVLEELDEANAVGCASCKGVATDATAPYCETCHDYSTNVAPLLAEWTMTDDGQKWIFLTR